MNRSQQIEEARQHPVDTPAMSDAQPLLFRSPYLSDWFAVAPYDGTGQPEGSGAEWREILAAMKERRSCTHFRRIAVEFDSGGNAWFWSPRNSLNHMGATVHAADVDAWVTTAGHVLEGVTQ